MSFPDTWDRREFLRALWRLAKLGAVGALGLLGVSTLRSRSVRAEVAPAGQAPLRPPGALPEDEFRAACTRCFLCGEVCPVRCIEFPSRVEGAQPMVLPPSAGGRARTAEPPVWAGDDTPYVLPWRTACILCMDCTTVCPTGALRPVPAADAGMGVAVIDRKICLPWTRTSWCGACYTACPFKERAIALGDGNRPTINPDHCVGCGLCVEVCPIKYKAIAVVPPFYPDRGGVRPE